MCRKEETQNCEHQGRWTLQEKGKEGYCRKKIRKFKDKLTVEVTFCKERTGEKDFVHCASDIKGSNSTTLKGGMVLIFNI